MKKKRVLNFSAGPSTLPLEVLEEIQEHIISLNDNGVSVAESSHRVKLYEDIQEEALNLIRENLRVPDNFKIILMQGGASGQFALVPMNLKKSGIVEYADTGVWTNKAIKEAQILGLDVRVVASSEKDNYSHIPEINFSKDADFGYIASNNTIYGTQFKKFPDSSCLVVDASSDIFSYHYDWSKIGLIFAGAQKNAGIAGVTIVIVREDLLDRTDNTTIPRIFRYKDHVEAKSFFHTPPTFSIYVLCLAMRWLKKQGGIDGISKINEKKAALMYDVIDNSNGFYKGYAQKDFRSQMNVSFTLQDETLLPILFEKAAQNDIICIKGHRLLGGVRASIYNAMSLENTKFLADFLNDFRLKNS